MDQLRRPPHPASPAPLLSLRGYGVAYRDRRVLEAIDLDVAARGILVIMGPAGTGKSTLLRTICGEGGSADVRIAGEATFGGLPLATGNRPVLVAQKLPLLMATVLDYLAGGLPDRGRLKKAEQRQRLGADLERAGLAHLVDAFGARLTDLTAFDRKALSLVRALAGDPPLICIDELTAGLDDHEAAKISAIIKAEGERRAIIAVTHHQQHARLIADDVALLAGGRIVERNAAKSFFENPATAEATHFLRTGSSPLPSLNARLAQLAPDAGAAIAIDMPRRAFRPDSQGPTGFRWLIDGVLGGTRQPGMLADMAQELRALRNVGVTTLVTLTEKPLDSGAGEGGLRQHWLPIKDMGAPAIEAALDLCMRMEREIAQGGAVVYHCMAGHGRTGLMLVAHLIYRGMPAQQALAHARRRKSFWVQSLAQEQFLWDLDLHLAMTRSEAPVTA